MDLTSFCSRMSSACCYPVSCAMYPDAKAKAKALESTAIGMRCRAKRDQTVNDASTVLCTHMDIALRSHGPGNVEGETHASIPLFRTLQDWPFSHVQDQSYEAVQAVPQAKLLSSMNCHQGQKKLVMALLEFVAISVGQLACRPADVWLVYVGASGMAAAIAASVFPEARFWLFDPAPNTIQLLPPSQKKVVVRDPAHVGLMCSRELVHGVQSFVVFTGSAGMFGDGTVGKILRVPNRQQFHLLFVSDIRSHAPLEETIVNDMTAQQRWVVGLGADAYMLKWRSPYGKGQEQHRLMMRYRSEAAQLFGWQENGSDAATTEIRRRNSRLPYLDGQLYIQLYARKMSAELRLMGCAEPLLPLPLVGGDSSRSVRRRYRCRVYDTDLIEGRMAVFNVVYRSHACFRFGNSDSCCAPPVTPVSNSFQSSLSSSYEAVSEYAIVCACVAATSPANVPQKCREQTVELAYSIARLLATRLTTRDPHTCPLTTVMSILQ